MKLQIKTHTKKTLVLEMDATNTVHDLKMELAMYPEIDTRPELQKITYAGKMLEDDNILSTYNIDIKRLLNIEILKEPLKPQPIPTSVLKSDKTDDKLKVNKNSTDGKKETKEVEEEFKVPTATATSSTNSKVETMVSTIVSMGYPEVEVRRALSAGFNNPERAIQYLVEGIPTSPSNPEHSTDCFDTDQSMNPVDVFLRDARFSLLRQRLQNDPEYLAKFLEKIGDDDPELLHLISDNQDAFFKMLVENEDLDGEEEEEEDVETEIQELIGDLDEEDFEDDDDDVPVVPEKKNT